MQLLRGAYRLGAARQRVVRQRLGGAALEADDALGALERSRCPGDHPVVSLYQVAPAAVPKGPQMAATTTLETNSAAQRRLAKELAALDRSIDKEQVGPRRLELLREQASVSDKLEALRSTRV
jgi:hypothetical protein